MISKLHNLRWLSSAEHKRFLKNIKDVFCIGKKSFYCGPQKKFIQDWEVIEYQIINYKRIKISVKHALIVLWRASHECSRLRFPDVIWALNVSFFSFTFNKISDDSVQLEGCFIVKKFRAQMKTILFLLRVPVVVPYTPIICPPTTLCQTKQQFEKHFWNLFSKMESILVMLKMEVQ